MTAHHLATCNSIVADSEPWKTLGERIDFKRFISLRHAYVYLDKGIPAGFVLFNPEPVFARGGYLRAIGVAPTHRRLGVGTRLLSFAEQITARSSDNLFLCVSSFNRAGQAFYKRLGYKKAGILKGIISPDS
jgi:ribosomal protein S18 acetylase RimI-like enzyme